MMAMELKVWAEFGVGVGVGEELPANGQLVTKPTLLLKLGHRIEMGTAELSPNRTVAHLVPGLGNTWRDGGRAKDTNPAVRTHFTHKPPWVPGCSTSNPSITPFPAWTISSSCHLDHQGPTSYRHKVFREPVQEEKLPPPDRDKGEAIYLGARQRQVEQGQLQPPLGTRYSSEQSPQGTAGPPGQYRSPTLPRMTDGGTISVRCCLLPIIQPPE